MAIQDVIRGILQDKKKLAILVGAPIIIIAIIILLSSSSSNTGPSLGGGMVSQIVLAKGETSDRRPINPTNYFSLDDPEIHAIVSFSNVPAQSTILFQWYDLNGKKILKDDPRSTGEATFSGLGTSSIVRNTQDRDNLFNWGLGNYELRVFLNGALAGSQKYFVQTDLEIEKNKILSSIEDVQLTTAVDLQGRPTRSVGTVFSENDDKIIASLAYNNLSKGVTIEGRWTYVNESRLIDRYQKDIFGTGVLSFNINTIMNSWIPTKKWPIGKYRLDLYIDGETLETVDFEVK